MHATSNLIYHDESLVCRLKKSLSRLKQDPRACFDKCRLIILKASAIQSIHDFSLFAKPFHEGLYCFCIH